MKKFILTATLAAFAITSAAWAAPIKNEQPGDLKANINYPPAALPAATSPTS